MNRPVLVALALAFVLPAVGASTASAQFTYRPAGELVSGSGTGRVDGNVYVPDMRFPLEETPAFANSQVYAPGGGFPPPGGGGQCDNYNYSFPWRDNFCESRSHAMPMCPSGTGHQGQDIRAATCANNTHWAVAVVSGTVTQVGSYSVYITDSAGRRFDYLHMSSVQVRRGQTVRCGDRLGKVSNAFGGTPTTYHLHFNIRMAVRGYTGQPFTPPYMSLVGAYGRLARECTEPAPLCTEAEMRSGAPTCETADGRDACIGSVAFAGGCPEGAGGQIQGRTCSCVSDGSGGARWDCPVGAACRPVDVCELCGVVGGGTPPPPGEEPPMSATCGVSPGHGGGSAFALACLGLLGVLLGRRRRA